MYVCVCPQLGLEGEVKLSLLGTTFGVLSSLFVCLNTIFTKSCLDVVGGNKMRLTAYNNTNAALLFVPLIYFFEWDVLMSHTHVLLSPSYWVMMTLGGVFGFAIGIVTMLQIQVGPPRLPCPALPFSPCHVVGPRGTMCHW